MKKLLSVLTSSMLVLTLSACGLVDGRYRYPCQDPANWEKTECKPPVCEVNGYCPVDLVGEDVFNSTSKDGTVEDTNVEGNK